MVSDSFKTLVEAIRLWRQSRHNAAVTCLNKLPAGFREKVVEISGHAIDHGWDQDLEYVTIESKYGLFTMSHTKRVDDITITLDDWVNVIPEMFGSWIQHTQTS